MVERMFSAAVERRERAGLARKGTDMYRLVHEAADGLPGLIVDKWGSCAVVRLRTKEWMDAAPRMQLRDLLVDHGMTSMHWVIDEPGKDRTREYAEAEAGMNKGLEAAGLLAPEQLEGMENGRKYLIRPMDGYSQGLFTDMRAPRAELAARWKNRSVLNLFSYTCGFGVAMGNSRVTNVDVSARYLDWGKENYALNGLPVHEDTFVCEDAFSYLEQVVADGRRYDAIICDPPAFSQGKTGKSRQFSVRRDLGTLVEMVIASLNPGGEALVSTNLNALGQDSFIRLMMGISTERGWTVQKSWAPDVDYPVSVGEYHLKTALLVPIERRVD
jgi:23S rRNA (cytosine1962-C5)-methyltransferase